MAEVTEIVPVEAAAPTEGTGALEAEAPPTPTPKPITRSQNTYMDRCLQIREAFYNGAEEFHCPYEGCEETLRVKAIPPRDYVLSCGTHGRIIRCEG